MFTGLSAFPLTPMGDEAAFERLVGRLAEAGVDSIGALGSTGNYAYLTREERARAARLAVGAAGPTPVMIGVGAARTEHAIAHAHDAQAAGAAAVLLAPVSYQPLTDEEVFGLFADVTGSDLTIPVCVYDNPVTTRFTFSDELHVRIAALDGIGAIKLPGAGAPERLPGLREAIGSRVAIGVSGDPFAVAGLNAGAAAWYSVLGGLFPRAALEIARERDDTRFAPLWALFRRHGGLRVVATAAVILGLAGADNLPRPLQLLDRGEVEPVLDELELR